MVRLRSQLPFLALAAVLGWLVLPPFFFVLRTSLLDFRSGELTLQHYSAVLAAGGAGPSILVDSLAFASGSAALALPLGALLAWFAERTNAPFRGLAYLAAYASFALPGIVKVIGWILLLGPRAGLVNLWLRQAFGLPEGPFDIFSLGGMILVEALLWTPIVFLLLAVPFRSLDPALEESAAACGAGPWQTLGRVTLPLALPSILAVLLLTFARSLESFEIPALLGIPGGVSVFTTEIYLLVRRGVQARYGEATAYSTLLMLLVALALYPYYRATRHAQRFATITGRGFRPRPLDLGRWRYLAAMPMLLLPLMLALPLLALLWASLLPFFRPPSPEALTTLTLDNYAAAFANTGLSRAAGNTLVVGFGSASATVCLTLLVAWLVVRTRLPARWALDQLAMLPLVIPGVVLGVAVLRTYVGFPIPIYGTLWILVLAFVSRFLPFGMRYAHSGLLSVQRELEESAQLSGASWWTTLRRITLPLILPALAAGWIYVFLITTRELSIALLLYSPGTQLLAVSIWELWENGHVTQLAAFSVALVLILLPLPLLLHLLARHTGIRPIL